jgi:glutamyl-tRNA reductase
MQQHFKAISLSYKSVPLDIRELVSFDEQACKRLLQYFKEFTPISEALVLSTCNRTEVYYIAEEDCSSEIIKLIGLERQIDDIASYHQYFRQVDEANDAIKHLFRVSLGLEAQVVGDLQISNQVKNAYQWAADESMAGPFLHRLMHTIFYTSKRVVQETPFRDGAASVSYAAVQLIEELTTSFVKPKIMVLGLGQIGEDVCKNLVDYSKSEVYIVNRTLEKSLTIASECGFSTIPFESFEGSVGEMDVIISSVMMDKPILTKELIGSKEILSHKILMDLSVPRSIENAVEEIPGVLLYNIDNIHSKANATLEKRMSAIPLVERIVDEALAEFDDWSKEMEVSPTIQKLKNALEQIRKEELSRHLKTLNEKESDILDKATKSMMQKIIKLPVLQLKAACKRGEAETLIDLLNDLFDLEKEQVKSN